MASTKQAAVQAQFNRIARLYRHTAAQATRQEFGRHLHALDWTRVRTALDVACGPASLAALLAGRAERVFALDIAAEMLREGRELCRQQGVSNVTFVQGSLEALPFASSTTDALTCGFVYPALARPQQALAEMRRVLRPGGRALLLEVVAPEDAAAAAYLDRVESLHQGGPTEVFSAARFQSLFVSAALELEDCRIWRTPCRFREWAALGELPAGSAQWEEARRLIRDSARLHPLLFCPQESRDDLVFHYTVALFVLRRTAAA